MALVRVPFYFINLWLIPDRHHTGHYTTTNREREREGEKERLPTSEMGKFDYRGSQARAKQQNNNHHHKVKAVKIIIHEKNIVQRNQKIVTGIQKNINKYK